MWRGSNFFKKIDLFIFIFGCVGSLLLPAGFIQLRRAGAVLRCSVRASHCGGFSCCGARALGTRASVVVARGLSSCGLRALECRFSSCGSRAQLLSGMWDLPRPGIKPLFPALAGRLLTIVPPGKSLKWASCRQLIYGSCFCIHSASLCLLVGAFHLFTFKVIIDMYAPITIFLIVLACFYGSFSSLVFPSQRSFFSICCRAGLVVLNSLSFCLSVKLLISLLNLNEILAGQSNLGCKFFPFITLNISCHSLLSSCALLMYVGFSLEILTLFKP